MSWQPHPAAHERSPETLVALFTSHLHIRLMLESLVEAEGALMGQIVEALSHIPESRLERVVGECVQAAAARVVSDAGEGESPLAASS